MSRLYILLRQWIQQQWQTKKSWGLEIDAPTKNYGEYQMMIKRKVREILFLIYCRLGILLRQQQRREIKKLVFGAPKSLTVPPMRDQKGVQFRLARYIDSTLLKAITGVHLAFPRACLTTLLRRARLAVNQAAVSSCSGTEY